MSMIRAVTYKVSLDRDGHIFSESIEYGADIDTMPLSRSQLDDAGARVSELRDHALGLRKAWEGGALTAEVSKDDEAKVIAPVEVNTPTVEPIAAESVIIVPPKAQTFEVSPEYATKMSLPAYDRNGLKWNYCPEHIAEDINHVSVRTGKHYQACRKCKVFLGVDGKKTPMGGSN